MVRAGRWFHGLDSKPRLEVPASKTRDSCAKFDRVGADIEHRTCGPTAVRRRSATGPAVWRNRCRLAGGLGFEPGAPCSFAVFPPTFTRSSRCEAAVVRGVRALREIEVVREIGRLPVAVRQQGEPVG
jgi:hypothetical protein